MVKSKSKAIFSVADGAGGMMEVKDHRFEKGDWPIKFEVPVEQEKGGPLAALSERRMPPARLVVIGAWANRPRRE
jgi:hypothetical protein